MLREDKRLIEDLHVAVTGGLAFLAYAAVYFLMRRHQPPLRAFPDYLPTIAIIIVGIMAALKRRAESAAMMPPMMMAIVGRQSGKARSGGGGGRVKKETPA